MNGRKIGCETFNITDCETYQYHFSLENIKQTLHCLGYDRHRYPLPKPTKVQIERKVNYLMKMDENERLIHLEEQINLKVLDNRLSLGFCVKLEGNRRFTFFGRGIINQIFWIPDFDTFEETTFKPTFNKAYLRFGLDGKKHNIKIFNENYKTTIRCPMNYKWYPFDTHTCSHDFVINESPENVEIEYDVKEITKNSKIGHSLSPDWYITLKVGQVTKEGKKQLLPLNITFERILSGHILHVYVPSLMLAVASVTSLFIPPENVPGRMSLSVTSCLSMVTLFVGAK